MSMITNSQSNTPFLDPKLDPTKSTKIGENKPNRGQKLDPKLDPKQKRKTIVLKDLVIKHLKPQEKRVIYWCSERINLGVRVFPSGNKSWIYEYRYHNRTKRLTLGKYPKLTLKAALKKYYEIDSNVSNGFDPLHEKNIKSKRYNETPTLDELIGQYIDYCKNSDKVTYQDEERCFKAEFSKNFRKQKIIEVDYKELAYIFHKIVARGSPSTASHLFSYTRRLFNYAADMGLLRYSENPCNEIKLKIPKGKKNRHLNLREVYRFWHRLKDVPTSPIIKLALKFLLLTVARPIEVRKAKWSDINFNDRIWTQPKTKNKKLHRVYLGNLALELLEQAKEYTSDRDYIFSSPRFLANKTRGKANPELLERNSLSQPIVTNFDMFQIAEKFTPHDLRRTGATMIAGLFGRRDFATMALNHTNNDATSIYDQYVYDREKKLMLDALNKAIESVINSSNIESIPSFDMLRDQIIGSHYSLNADQKQGSDNQEGLKASLEYPLSYRLSYYHDGLNHVA